MSQIKWRELLKYEERGNAFVLVFEALQRENSPMSVHSAAEAYGIAYSMLRDRLHSTQTRQAAHIKQQLIIP